MTTKAQRDWYLRNRELTMRRAAAWAKRNRGKRLAIVRNSFNARAQEMKLIVFSHYGKGGKPICKWRGCLIHDLDLLSLDHINDDGAKHRKRGKHSGGMNFYWQLYRLKFPKGFQVLCWNHQWKKEILRRREARL